MKQKFKVHEGTTFESRPKFKKGDFVTADSWDGSIAIYLSDEKLTAWCHPSGVPIYDPLFCTPQKKATTKEKRFLLDKLHEDGKYWDFETCDFIDYILIKKL